MESLLVLYKRVGTVSIAIWGDQFIVYHHESGDTHLLDSSFLPFVEFFISNDIISPDDLINRYPGLYDSMRQNQDSIDNVLHQFVHLNMLIAINCECQ